MSRPQPNIIVTGTPGVGKTSHCELLASNADLRHLSVNQIVKEKECHEGWDDEFKSWIVDDDKVRLGCAICTASAWLMGMFHVTASRCPRR